jgi:ATP-dependent RNA helicase DDX41
MRMTDWRAPGWTALVPEEAWSIVREKHRILIDSEDSVPPPLERFEDMKLPRWLQAALESRGIKVGKKRWRYLCSLIYQTKSPSPIQIQGLPCALSGRDMIGIAYTGSGKTLVFALPLFLYALSEETLCPLSSRTGPLGIIVCPSRELAEQSHQIICQWAEAGVKVERREKREFLRELTNWHQAGVGEVRSMLCIGGTSVRDSFASYDRGVHVIVVNRD